MNVKSINKILLLALCLMAIACEKHDKIDDLAMIGQRVPTAYWELKSDQIKYGQFANFTAQYYTDGPEIKELSVWHDVNEHIAYTVECPIVSTFKYSVNFESNKLIREFQKLHSYQHSETLWNDSTRSYLLKDKFKISYTLSPLSWHEVTVYDDDLFVNLFPDNFKQAFRDSITPKLQVLDYRKILTVSNPRMSTKDFDSRIDSVINDNTGRYDYFFKDQKFEAEMKGLFNTIPFDSLTYDKANQVFKINYLREYFLNSKFAVMDEFNRLGYSESKQMRVN